MASAYAVVRRQGLCARHPTGVPGIDEGEETVADRGEETRRDHAIGNQGVRCAGQAAQIGAGPYDRHSVIPGLDNAVPVSLER